MNVASERNVGGFVAVATSVLCQAASAAVNGGGIDREAHNLPLSCILHTVAGAETGSPSGVSLVSKIQDSADGTTYADYIPPGQSTVAASTALTAINTENSLAVELSSARRWIRAVATPTFTGGTSPTILVAVDIILGGEFRKPAV